MTNLDRRSFLKRGGALTAGTLTPGGRPAAGQLGEPERHQRELSRRSGPVGLVDHL
jgi:hypothetical protein